MDVRCHPAKLTGTVQIPASKSILHRAMICAALAPDCSVIRNVYFSEDVKATMACLRALGASFDVNGSTVTVYGITHPRREAILDCKESGSTIRFLLPIAAALGASATFLGQGRLTTRPLGLFAAPFAAHGVAFDYSGVLPCAISGRLTGGEFTLPGNVSSQFITGLLLALPLCGTDSTITVLPPFESKSYVQITCAVMQQFGVRVYLQSDGHTFRIPGGQHYRAADYLAESDCSQAAFFLAANALGQEITLASFADHSVQGDFACFDLARQSGLVPTFADGQVTTKRFDRKPLLCDASDIPDLVPALAVLATTLNGTSWFTHVARLALKESDRIATTIEMLQHLGGSARYDQERDTLFVEGNTVLTGGVVDSHNDHRIAMAAAIAATTCTGDVLLQDAQAVNKSYPTFWETYRELGGQYDVISME